VYYSLSVHTMFITVHAKFYNSSKEGSKPHLPHLHLISAYNVLVFDLLWLFTGLRVSPRSNLIIRLRLLT